MKQLTYKDFEELTGLHQNTIRNYLQNYKFNKFFKKKKWENFITEMYEVNDEFIEKFNEYLLMRRRIKASRMFMEKIKEIK